MSNVVIGGVSLSDASKDFNAAFKFLHAAIAPRDFEVVDMSAELARNIGEMPTKQETREIIDDLVLRRAVFDDWRTRRTIRVIAGALCRLADDLAATDPRLACRDELERLAGFK